MHDNYLFIYFINSFNNFLARFFGEGIHNYVCIYIKYVTAMKIGYDVLKKTKLFQIIIINILFVSNILKFNHYF